MRSSCLIPLVGWKKLVFSPLIKIEIVEVEMQDRIREDILRDIEEMESLSNEGPSNPF